MRMNFIKTVNLRIVVTVLMVIHNVALCSQELYVTGNAANKANEVNSDSGWAAFGVSTATSVTDQDGSSSYSIEVTAGNGTGFNAAQTSVSNLISGEQYTVTIRARNDINNTDNGAFFAWNGIVGTVNAEVTSSQYQDYVIPITSNGNDLDMTIYGCLCNDTSNKVYISSISVKLTSSQSSDTQAPTAPTTLSSTVQSQTTIALDWTAATDDVGVTGYKVFRNSSLIATLGAVTSYTATGLTAGTQYSFHVTALDAANNESVASSSISATTDTASGGGSGGLWTESGSDIHYTTGNVGIGTANPNGWKLAVNGHIRAKEIKVETDWADYVFKEGYDLPTLEEVEKHIKEKGHLINIPSAMEVEANGIQLGEMNKLLLEKIEELTLYVIQLKNENKKQASKTALKDKLLSKKESSLIKRLDIQEERIAELENLIFRKNDN